MARTHTISNNVNPPCAQVCSRHPVGDIGCRPSSAFLTVRAQRDNVVEAVLAGRSIYIRFPPWIQGHIFASEVGTIPGGEAANWLDKSNQTLTI